jgi:hypothetical protein
VPLPRVMKRCRLIETALGLALATLLTLGAEHVNHVPHYEATPHLLRVCASIGTASSGLLTVDVSDSLDSWADRVEVALLPA